MSVTDNHNTVRALVSDAVARADSRTKALQSAAEILRQFASEMYGGEWHVTVDAQHKFILILGDLHDDGDI